MKINRAISILSSLVCILAVGCANQQPEQTIGHDDGRGLRRLFSGIPVSITVRYRTGFDAITRNATCQASVTYTPATAYFGADAFSYTASDGNGGTATANVSVTVSERPNAPPTASLTATPSSGDAPLAVTLSGAGSSDPDAGDSISSYTFNFGDGSATVTQSAAATMSSISS